jgi:DNA-binding LacI/PurR family transcriptional regulator
VSAVRALREQWVDAVIVTASRVGSFYAQLTEIRVPVVLINNQQSGEYSFSVRSDDFYGGQLVGNYLLELGHRHVAYISGRQATTSSQLRLRGCQDALRAAGVSIPAEWVVFGDGKPASGQRAVQSLIKKPVPGKPLPAKAVHPTAIFCYNDQTAMGALRAIKSLGLNVPQDISLVGYDDIAAAFYLDPPLTTVAQAKYELGQRAMDMALALIAGEEIQDVLLSPELVIRSSCAQARQAHG